MTGTSPGPKVVLVGGSLTVDDGSRLDSRQLIDGDDASQVMRRSLANSWLWWTTTSSLVMPILEAAGPEAFALVIGERSIVDLRPDGSIKRTGLRGLLPGGTGTVRIHRTGPKHDELPPGFDEVTTLRAWNGQSMGKIGVQPAGTNDSRWRFLDGEDYYLTHAGPHIAPTVIVDAGDLLTVPIAVPTDDGLRDHPREFYVEARFQALEQRRLFGDVVLIVPHTHQAEVVLRDYTMWVQSNRSEVTSNSLPISNAPWDPAARLNPVHYARPVPIDAEFGVTGLVEDGQWQSPDDLEAARSLLAARFDLKIGIWDLVSNSLLRRTLLETVPVDPAPMPVARVPRGARQREEATVASKVAQREQEAMALQVLREEAQPLLRAGWRVAKGPELLRLPLTEPVHWWSPEKEPIPLVYLTLSITKRQTSVLVRTVMYNQVDLPRYVSARRDSLEQVAQMELPGLDMTSSSVLWRGEGGWGDDVEWRARFDELALKTVRWIPLFTGLVAECQRSARMSL